MKLRGFIVLAGLAIAAPAFAALPASDNASDGVYSGGLASGLNGGSGWLPWVVQTNGGAGAFAGSYRSTAGAAGGNGASGNPGMSDIGSLPGNFAWGTFAGGTNTNGFGKFAAHRRLTGDAFNTNNLVNGQTIGIGFEHSNINISPSGFAGVKFGGLQSIDPFTGGLTGTLTGNAMFGFQGGDTTYSIWDNSGKFDTGIAFSRRGLLVEFILVNDFLDLYNLRVTALDTNVVSNFNGRTKRGGGIDQISLYNWYTNGGGGQDAHFNQLSLVPAPGAAALLGLGGLMVARRRR